MATTKKPFIIMCSHPVNGHVQPIRLIASHLLSLSYPITVLLPHAYKESFSKLPLSFVSLTGIADYTEKDFDVLQPERKFWPPGLEQMAYRAIAPTRAIFRQSRALQSIILDLQKKDPERKIVIVQESHFRGCVPMLLRIPGLICVPVISIGVTPLIIPTLDFPLMGIRTFPDTSEEARKKTKEGFKAIRKACARPMREFKWVLEDLGLQEGTKIPHLIEQFQLAQTHLQMCVPSLELTRTDMPENVRFIGPVPQSDVDEWTDRPGWWKEVEESGKEGRSVVAVTQGTMDVDYTELIIPTIEALRDRKDMIVVIVLGIRGAKLPDEIRIAEHIHVIDYVPYTELLKHSTLFLTNGGYNGVQQSLSFGVPILKAGNDGDKLATGNRIEWTGCGLDLWNTRPSPEQVREGVETVLREGKYKKRAEEISEETKQYDPLKSIVEEIEAMARGRHSDGSELRSPGWTSLFSDEEVEEELRG